MSANKRKRIRKLRKELMSDNPTPDEVAALLNGLQQDPVQQPQPTQLEIACGGRLLLVQIPATLEFKDDRPNFVVNDLSAWGYSPFGILAVGTYEGSGDDAKEESKVFAGDTVHNITFNKARYEEIIEEIRAEEAEAENVPDDESGEAQESADDELAETEVITAA